MTQDIIKQTALTLFQRYSFVKTTVADIASASGIGKGSVYLAYKSKDEILASIMNDMIKTMRAKNDSWFFDPAVDLDTKIVRISSIILDEIFQIRDLMFGTIENIKGQEVREIYERFYTVIGQFSDYLFNLAISHGFSSEPARLDASREYLLTLLGRFAIHVFSHDWNDSKEIHAAMTGWSVPVFRSLVLKEFK